MPPRPPRVCSIHDEFCIPTARLLYQTGIRLELVGTEYHDEMLSLLAADRLKKKKG